MIDSYVWLLLQQSEIDLACCCTYVMDSHLEVKYPNKKGREREIKTPYTVIRVTAILTAIMIRYLLEV